MERERIGDRELLLLLKSNPQLGLARAIQVYGGTVNWIVVKILGATSREDREECVSDVFVSLWQGVENFHEDERKLSSYLYGIARHKALDYKSKRNRESELCSEIVDEEWGMDTDFSEELAKKENAKIIQEVVDALPEPDRQIFLFRYYFDEKVASIAERLGLPKKQVENKLYRGKAELRRQLTERGVIL